MTTKDEALKLALEALEPFTTPNWAGTGVDKSNEAYAAICEALNAPLAEQKSGIKQVIELYGSPEKPAPVAKPHEQKPAFYRHEDGHLMTPDRAKFLGFDLNDLQALYTSPPAQRKPLTDDEIAKEVEAELTHYWNGEYIDTTGARDQLTAFARAIEAAHGIKENT